MVEPQYNSLVEVWVRETLPPLANLVGSMLRLRLDLSRRMCTGDSSATSSPSLVSEEYISNYHTRDKDILHNMNYYQMKTSGFTWFKFNSWHFARIYSFTRVQLEKQSKNSTLATLKVETPTVLYNNNRNKCGVLCVSLGVGPNDF